MEYAAKYLPLRTYHIEHALIDAESVIDTLHKAETEEELAEALAVFAGLGGIVMTGHISLLANSPHHTAHYSISDQLNDYVEVYRNQGFVSDDPVLWRGQREILPIPWGLKEHLTNLAPREAELYGLMNDYGMKRGMLVPIHGPDGFSALGIALDEDEPGLRMRLPQLGAMAQLVAIHLHDAVRRIIFHAQSNQIINLTRRERECLSWAAAGKRAADIGALLKIAESTAIFHIANAKRKLEAQTLTQAVAKAYRLGLITP